MQKKSKLSRRITWRVIGIIMFFNVFIMVAVVMFCLAMSAVDSETRVRYVMDGIQGKLETMHSAVEIAATNNVAEIEAHLGSSTELFDALEHVLRLNRYMGCAVAMEPHFFPGEGRWFEPYVSFADSTHVERQQIGSEQHDYFQQEWYTRGLELERGQGVMTDPYFDADGMKGIVSTYVTPVYDRQGHKVGVYGINLDLNWLEAAILQEEERIKEIEMAEDDEDEEENLFFVQLIDGQGRKVAGSETFAEATLQKILQQDSAAFKPIKLNETTYYVCARGLKGLNWTLIVSMHWSVVYMNGLVLCCAIFLFIVIGAIVVFFFTGRSIGKAIRPLRFLTKSAQEVAKGNFDTPLPTFRRNDEIAQLRDSFGTMQQSLKQYVEELTQSTAAKASIESELNVAQSIQMSMLPKTFPAFPERDDIELYGALTPAKAVGGDLYDFFLRDETLFFCIGDVSGKGVPASLVMAVTRTLFRNVATHVTEPGLIVEAMNRAISDGNDNNMFVTLFVGALDLVTGHLRYCNAGHDAPIIINDECHSSFLPCLPNLPVGVMADWTFQEQEANIATGTMLFLYTDGLTEAENAAHELFGEQRIVDTLTTASKPQDLIEAMIAAVHQFVGDYEQSDDLTLLAIKLKLKIEN